MWRQIRGQGLSYGYNIYPRPNEGLLYLTFYRSTNIVAAYKEAKSIVVIDYPSNNHYNSKLVPYPSVRKQKCLYYQFFFQENHLPGDKWEQALFESAKSSLIFEIIEREKSVGDMVSQSLLSYFKNVSHDYNRRMVQYISAVTVQDMSRVGPKYVKQLFDPKNCKTTIVCHPSKANEIAEGFSK